MVFGSGRPLFATDSLTNPLRLENPVAIVGATPSCQATGSRSGRRRQRLRPTVVSIPTRSMRGASAAIT
jgi:hypothetical protein